MVDILLPTYQSELYLIEQLESIVSQSYSDWRLIVRDDGSTDSTITLLKKYIAFYGTEKIILLEDSDGNIGIIRSIERMLTFSTSEYIMFCDHDDYWLPNKIEITFQEIKRFENIHPMSPLLVHTDLCITDENLKVKHRSFASYSKINCMIISKFQYLAVCNSVTGCTMMINKLAKEISLPFSEFALMHDSWIALRVAQNGYISYLNTPTILYRQHNNNQVGASEINSSISYVMGKIVTFKSVISNNKKQFTLLKSISNYSLVKYIMYKLYYYIRYRL